MKSAAGTHFFILICLLALPAQATITLTEITAPSFGLILSGASGRQFILNTSATISGTHASDHVSSAIAGAIDITDTTLATIEIIANNIGSAGGLTVNEILCSYGGGAQTRCDLTPLVVTVVTSDPVSLKIGVDITTTQVHSGGDSASASFDIDVTYQ